MDYSYLSIFRLVLMVVVVIVMVFGWTLEIGEIQESDGRIYTETLRDFVLYTMIGLGGVALAQFIRTIQQIEDHLHDIRYIMRKKYYQENVQGQKKAETKEGNTARYKFRY